MNYEIHYTIDYRYDGQVTDNLNTLRVQPTTNALQRCDDFRVRLDPEARINRYLDYYGTEVIEFGIARPHDRLLIDINALVGTTSPPEPLRDGTWSSLVADPYQLEAAEFLPAYPGEPKSPVVQEMTEAVRADTPIETVERLKDLVLDRFQYRPGATYVGSTVDDLIDAGAGVCQDFAHLSLVLLRRNGIAARYVSGYLFSTGDRSGEHDPPATQTSVEVQTHAWVEALVPGGDGGEDPRWVGVDPTNRRLCGPEHVKIGHGRHYTDVPPTKGVYFGPSNAELEVHVTMTRLDSASA